MNESNNPFFAPQLHIQNGITDLSFYEKAFGATELRRFTNEDNSIHVAELSIGGSVFHLHEEKVSAGLLNPKRAGGVTVKIGLFVTDVDTVLEQAISAGATLISPAQSYDYGYRQGEIKDPFGHVWLIEMKI